MLGVWRPSQSIWSMWVKMSGHIWGLPGTPPLWLHWPALVSVKTRFHYPSRLALTWGHHPAIISMMLGSQECATAPGLVCVSQMSNLWACCPSQVLSSPLLPPHSTGTVPLKAGLSSLFPPSFQRPLNEIRCVRRSATWLQCDSFLQSHFVAGKGQWRTRKLGVISLMCTN